MANAVNRLSNRNLPTTSGMHADGAGLYLRIKPKTLKRSWVLVWHERGKRREAGLGSAERVDLPSARLKAAAMRKLIAVGEDPVEKRRAERQVPTFGTVADELIIDMAKGKRSLKTLERYHRCIGEGTKDNWAKGAGGRKNTSTRTSPCYVHSLRELRVDTITPQQVIDALKPSWETLTSANEVRALTERVFDRAIAKGHRRTDNPAVWKGRLEFLLPAARKEGRGHHAALPASELPVFFERLRSLDTSASRALQLTILTAVRTNECLGAEWSEFDLTRSVWTIPAGRTKMRKEHRVALSSAAMNLLTTMDSDEGWLFPGQSGERPLCGMAMAMLVRRLKVDVTVHGFRSTFRDWAGDHTDAPREVAEACLAHTLGSASELAYRRSDALDRRRPLMDAWGRYCLGLPEPAGSAQRLEGERKVISMLDHQRTRVG